MGIIKFSFLMPCKFALSPTELVGGISIRFRGQFAFMMRCKYVLSNTG